MAIYEFFKAGIMHAHGIMLSSTSVYVALGYDNKGLNYIMHLPLAHALTFIVANLVLQHMHSKGCYNYYYRN